MTFLSILERNVTHKTFHPGATVRATSGVARGGVSAAMVQCLKFGFVRMESVVSDIPSQNGKECQSQTFPSWSHRTGYLWGHPRGGVRGHDAMFKFGGVRMESVVSDISFHFGKECHSQNFPSWSHRTGHLWGRPRGCVRGHDAMFKFGGVRMESVVSDIPFQNGKKCHSHSFP